MKFLGIFLLIICLSATISTVIMCSPTNNVENNLASLEQMSNPYSPVDQEDVIAKEILKREVKPEKLPKDREILLGLFITMFYSSVIIFAILAFLSKNNN